MIWAYFNYCISIIFMNLNFTKMKYTEGDHSAPDRRHRCMSMPDGGNRNIRRANFVTQTTRSAVACTSRSWPLPHAGNSWKKPLKSAMAARDVPDEPRIRWLLGRCMSIVQTTAASIIACYVSTNQPAEPPLNIIGRWNERTKSICQRRARANCQLRTSTTRANPYTLPNNRITIANLYHYLLSESRAKQIPTRR